MNGRGVLRYGERKILFDVLHTPRKTMEIAVHPDTRVVIKVPYGTHLEDIEAKARKRSRWITKQINYFEQFQPHTPPRQYISGETHLYLGRQYRLKVIQEYENNVRLSRGRLLVSLVEDTSPDKVRACLEEWYRARGKEKYQASLDRCFVNFTRMDFEQPAIKIRKMVSRWGSLSHNGLLTLNLSLIRAPRACIDYVITHELCHMEYHNHSSGFYKLLERVMPDWEKRKHRLELALV
ncbi:MAG: SprT family zinc-dependent metalloprotease [Gammaproteobacteria bacterium]|nr:MAG: SprT family zinc-dependent metalloprotease [Gammaproteobacteria bacterium]